MIRKIKDGEQYKEAKIISTDDIYVGADPTSSLGQIIDEHSEDIHNLKKWTKWYVKYGGMGSGAGGGGSTSSFGHKVYIKQGSQVIEVIGNTVNLWGKGTYTIMFNLTRTQGHSFRVQYKIGDGSTRSITIPEGENSIEIEQNLLTKSLFYYTIKDNSTDEDVTNQFTIIPESYSITPGINYKSGGSVIKNSAIAFPVLTSKLTGVFSASIFEAIPVYWEIRWKMEDESNWKTINTGVFEYDPEGKTKESTVSVDLSFAGLEQEAALGKEITIQLLYGLIEGSYTPTEAGTYTLTVIPEGYYLLLSDKEGRLYLNEPDPSGEGVNQLKQGYLPFYVNLCFESDTQDLVTMTLYKRKSDGGYALYGTPVSQTVQSNKTVAFSDMFRMTVTEPGVFKIVATSTKGANTVKYFYVKESASSWDYNQYGLPEGRTSSHFYYENNTGPFLSAPLTFFKNKYEKTISRDIFTGPQYNYNFALGFQYDKSNNDNYHFLELENISGEKLKVYQNKILLGDNTIIEDYYVPKTENSNEAASNLWHLLNINANFTRTSESGSQYFYELTVYVDGVIEGISKGTVDSSTSTALSNDYRFNIIRINPNEMHILKVNLLEATYTAIADSATFATETSSFYKQYNYTYDVYATTYYNKYCSNIGHEEKVLDTSSFSGRMEVFKFDEYGMPYTTSDNLSNIISELNVAGTDKLMKTPILILCPNEESQRATVGKGNFFKKWFSAVWPEDPENDSQKPSPISGYIYYVPGTAQGNLSQYVIKDDNNNKVGFTFEIQGSSTRSFGNKNIEVSINQTSEAVETVFTPNFHKDDNQTLLPEKSFTLKADMVDSSACNNNSIGAFINTNTLPLDQEHCPARHTVLSGHVKNCLTGFPVLMFIHIDNNDGEAEDKYYFAGIYNFNLGRKSYYNLGYYKEYDQKMLDLMTSSSQGVFQFFDVQKPEYNDYLAVTEISNGDRFFDFSQYDQSVLFAKDKSDSYSMFSEGDTIYNNENDFRSLITNAMKFIAKGGGFVFDQLKKNLKKIASSDQMVYLLHKDNVSLNYVADYQTQYTRVPGESRYVEKAIKDPKAEVNDLLNCIGTTIEEVANVPYLDLRSTVEYYVICMVFGMVDSVLKNMEIKSWNSKTIFPSFYDMDTALGVDNNGKNVDFFAFSDYWQNSTEPIQGYEDRVRAKGVEVYPDFFNPSSSYTGYDIPSSYLFAIAKYATMELMGVEDSIPALSSSESGTGSKAPLSPVNLYAYFRQKGGSLDSADTFMQKYFSKRLENIPNSFKNLNYRSKYAKVSYWLIKEVNCDEIRDVKSGSLIRVSDLSDLGKFNGTGINKKHDWLNSRLHLLDSYFNINADVKFRVREAIITPGIDEEVQSVEWKDIQRADLSYYYYPSLTGMSVSFGDDVSINSQIFSSTDGTKSTLNINSLLVKAPSFTPVIIYQAGHNPIPYLIGDDTKSMLFNIPINTVGNQDWGIYGSKEFSYINNLGLFRLNNVSITSDKLEDVTFTDSSEIGQNVTQNYTLITPNIENVVIDSPIYTKALTFSESLNYNRLRTINLSNSKLNCSYTKLLPIISLNLTGLQCGDNTFSLPNLPNLNEVMLDRAKFGSLSLPLWDSDVSITENDTNISSTASYKYHNVSIRTMNLNNLSGKTNTKLRLHSLSQLESVTVSGIEELEIYSCPNLKTVIIDSSIKRLTIRDCSGSQSVSNLTVNTGTGAVGVITLDKCPNLVYLDMYQTRKFNNVIINTIIELPSSAFQNCSELQYLDSKTNGEFRITGTSTFAYCSKFTLRNEAGGYPKVLFKSGLTNATSTFNCSNSTGSIDFNAANNFISNNYSNSRIGSLATINYWFYNQGHIGESMTFNENSYFTELKRYTHITSAYEAFMYCNIVYWTKELFNFGANGLTLDGTFYQGKTIHAKVDFLSNIGSKVTYYSEGWHTNYTFYNSSGTELTTVVMRDVINLPNATFLEAFYNLTANVVDVKNCFERATKLQTIYWFLRENTTWKNAVYTVDDEVTSCLQGLTNLRTIAESFQQKTTNNGRLDVFNLLSETQWKTMSNIFGNGTTSNDSWSWFNPDKEITYDNFLTLQDYLAHNSNITWIGPIFKNCNVIGCITNPEMLLPFDSVNRNITVLNQTYYNLKGFDEQGKELPVMLNEDFFENLTNMSTCYYTFANVWLGNQNGIPFNLFKKRSDIKETTGYNPNRTINTLDIDNRTYEYIYYYSTSLTDVPALPQDVDNTRAAYEQTSIFTTSEAANNRWIAFSSSSKVPKEGQTDTNRRVLWRAKRTRKGIDPEHPTWFGEFGGIETKERFDEPTVLEVKYTTYDNRNITDIRGLFYNCSYVNPFFKFNTSFLEDNKSYIKDNFGNEYNVYYIDRNCTIKGPYRPSYEIDDLVERDADYPKNITVNGRNLMNFALMHNTFSGRCYPFVSPDFFYGVNSSCRISNVFESTYSTSNTEEVIDGIGKYHALEGYIPNHLFNSDTSTSVTSIVECTNWIHNVNVIPVKYKDRQFVFIPENFMPTVNNVTYLFNFHIRVPNYSAGTEDNNEYYVMYSNSIHAGNNQVSLNNCLPHDTRHGSYGSAIIEDSGSNTIDVTGTNYDFNYHLILIPSQDESKGSVGYVNDYFPEARYQHFISRDLIFVLSGKVWGDSYILNNIKNLGDPVFDGVMTNGNGTHIGINRNFVFPKANNNFQNMNLFGSGFILNRVAKPSLNGSDTQWVSTFPTINIVN